MPPIGEVPATHPDGALIGLCTEFFAVDEQVQALDDRKIQLTDDEAGDLISEWWSYLSPIAEERAQTEAAQQIKLRAALAAMRNADGSHSTDRNALVRAALREAIGDAELPRARNPDAGLIAACDAIERLETDINAVFRGTKSIQDENAREVAAAQIEARQRPFIETVATTPARTLLGMQAKAQALTAWAPDMLKPLNATTEERLLLSLLADLTGRASA
jgi:hypothetical protein